MAQNIYYSNPSNNKFGKINIGLPVFNLIAEKAAKEVEGVHIDDSQGIFSYNKGSIVSELDGTDLTIFINIKITYGVVASAVSKQIQEKVTRSIMEMSNIKPKAVNVNVIGVEF